MSLHIGATKGQIAQTVLMPGDPLRAQFIAENFLDNAVRYSEIRNMYGYTGTYKGVPVSVQGSGMGMPSMGIYSFELFSEYEVENIIRIGTAGAFHEDISVGDILVSLATSTDSNYQHAFQVPGQYSPSVSFDLLTKVINAGAGTGIAFKAGNTVSCDVFYERAGGRNGSGSPLYERRLQRKKRSGHDDHQRSLCDRRKGYRSRASKQLYRYDETGLRSSDQITAFLHIRHQFIVEFRFNIDEPAGKIHFFLAGFFKFVHIFV